MDLRSVSDVFKGSDLPKVWIKDVKIDLEAGSAGSKARLLVV